MNEFLTIADALAEAVASLQSVSESPRLDAELLLARAIDVPRSYLIAHPEDTLDPSALARFRNAVTERERGKPMAYITGEKEFWSMSLMTSPATLIPRPDTETLVEHTLGYVPRRAGYRILDLGTGSGAIALAIARERPLCSIVATDISADALAIARENARQLDLANVTFLQGDWVEPVQGEQFDVIVSNPPYVRADDPALESLSFEPKSALVSGDDGLDDIRRIAADALAVIKPDGCLLVEHGADQREPVSSILQFAGWQDVRVIRDLAGNDRVCFARAP